MKLRISKYLFLLMMAVFALSSCSEDDNTVDEYANWQERNEKAFADTLAYARQQIANGSDEWKVILNWSLQNQTPNKDANGNTVSLTYKDVDYIVVHVLDKGKGSGCPMYTDSVKVSYRGRTYAVNSLVDGFTTALLNMHIGDRWMVYMPYQLAYGTTQSSSSTIPAYSMLRFEIVLDSYYRIGQVVPGSRAVEAGKKQGTWITE